MSGQQSEKPPPTKATRIPVTYEMKGSMTILGTIGWSDLHQCWAFVEVSLDVGAGVAADFLPDTLRAAGEVLRLSTEHFIATIPPPEDL